MALEAQQLTKQDLDADDINFCVFAVTIFCTMVGATLGAIAMIGFDAIDYFTSWLDADSIVMPLVVTLSGILVLIVLGSILFTKQLIQKKDADNYTFTKWARNSFNRHLHRIALVLMGFAFVCLPYAVVDWISGGHLNMFSELEGHYTGGLKFGACAALLILCIITIWETDSYQYSDVCDAVIKTSSGLILTTAERQKRIDNSQK